MAVKCGACGEYHDSAADVRECHGCSRAHSKRDQIAEVGRSAATPRSLEDKNAAAAHRRANPTWSEKAMWKILRGGIRGFKFAREVDVLGYRADFCCERLRLVVEVDGGYHRDRAESDSRRDQIMRANHYMVVRITDKELGTSERDVRNLITEVVRARAEELKRSPRSSGYSLDVDWHLFRYGELPPPAAIPEPPPVRRLPQPKVKIPKRKFRCIRCAHDFVAAIEPKPECRRCHSEDQLKCVCRVCDRLAVGTAEYCQGCWKQHEDMRGIAHNEASVWRQTGRHSRGT